MDTKRALNTFKGKSGVDFNFMEKEKTERFKKLCRDKKDKIYKQARAPQFSKKDEILLKKGLDELNVDEVEVKSAFGLLQTVKSLESTHPNDRGIRAFKVLLQKKWGKNKNAVLEGKELGDVKSYFSRIYPSSFVNELLTVDPMHGKGPEDYGKVTEEPDPMHKRVYRRALTPEETATKIAELLIKYPKAKHQVDVVASSNQGFDICIIRRAQKFGLTNETKQLLAEWNGFKEALTMIDPPLTVGPTIPPPPKMGADDEDGLLEEELMKKELVEDEDVDKDAVGGYFEGGGYGGSGPKTPPADYFEGQKEELEVVPEEGLMVEPEEEVEFEEEVEPEEEVEAGMGEQNGFKGIRPQYFNPIRTPASKEMTWRGKGGQRITMATTMTELKNEKTYGNANQGNLMTPELKKQWLKYMGGSSSAYAESSQGSWAAFLDYLEAPKKGGQRITMAEVKQSSKYTDFTSKYMKENSGSSLADAAKAWKSEKGDDKGEEKEE